MESESDAPTQSDSKTDCDKLVNSNMDNNVNAKIDSEQCDIDSKETLNQTSDPGGILQNDCDLPASMGEGEGVQESSLDEDVGEKIDFKVVYNKQKYDVTFPLDHTVAKLKIHIQTLTGVTPAMQKIMYKGLAKDESTLRDIKVTKGAKIMVVGSTLDAVLSVAQPDKKEIQEEAKAAARPKEALSQQKQHKKVLDKYGKPDDIIPGIKNHREALPGMPLSGMYNKAGGKVRLTFKLEADQLWIGTKERTDKIPMNSIKAVVSEPIEGNDEYHIMGIQLGPTEASRYWIYWVPAQYVDAIKDTVLGKWQYF